MLDYVNAIRRSGLQIYDIIPLDNKALYIPTEHLETILDRELTGTDLGGLPLRSRSKIVKAKVCELLGYPVPKVFKRTQPKFPGQNFDTYIQKSNNLQIWNEFIDDERRYAIICVDAEDRVTNVKVITGFELAEYDTTGKLTRKYQAGMPECSDSCLFSEKDTDNVSEWCGIPDPFSDHASSADPKQHEIIPVKEVYEKLLPMVGDRIGAIGADQERSRGSVLHNEVCKRLGFSECRDDGRYPDIRNQLIEIKLQTSPTIDLGQHSPDDGKQVVFAENKTFLSEDVRYVIFSSRFADKKIILKKLFVVTGADFTKHFRLFGGNVVNGKLQIPFPARFFRTE